MGSWHWVMAEFLATHTGRLQSTELCSSFRVIVWLLVISLTSLLTRTLSFEGPPCLHSAWVVWRSFHFLTTDPKVLTGISKHFVLWSLFSHHSFRFTFWIHTLVNYHLLQNKNMFSNNQKWLCSVGWGFLELTDLFLILRVYTFREKTLIQVLLSFRHTYLSPHSTP